MSVVEIENISALDIHFPKALGFNFSIISKFCVHLDPNGEPFITCLIY